MEEEANLTTTQVADLLGIQVRTVRLYARTHLLPSVQKSDPSLRTSGGGPQYLFRLSDIHAYQTAREEREKQPAMTGAERSRRSYARRRERARIAVAEGG